MRNIEIFDAFATYIVGFLHDAFPNERMLEPAKIVKATKLKAQAGENLEEYAISTIRWLTKVGILIADDPYNDKDRNLTRCRFVLSERSFLAMRLKPPAFMDTSDKPKPDATLGDMLHDIMERAGSKAKDAAADQAAKAFVPALLELFTRIKGGG